MKKIDGKRIASEILGELKGKVTELTQPPGLAFILVGDNPASLAYLRMKKKACAEIGIRSVVEEKPSSISETDLLRTIERFNRDKAIDGILVQLPLPGKLNALPVMRAIDPEKDIDGFHPINIGKLLLGETDGFIPCTPRGIQVLLERSHIPVEGKHVVIVGRSNIVGKPLAALLMQKRAGCNATVTLAHSQSEHLSDLTRSADILVAAIGQPKFIKKEMVKRGAVIVDVGISRQDGHLVGDVDFENVAPLASHITPVPGGVGPMTIAMLMANTYESATR